MARTPEPPGTPHHGSCSRCPLEIDENCDNTVNTCYDDDGRKFARACAVLRDLQQEGKIRHIGLSNVSYEQHDVLAPTSSHTYLGRWLPLPVVPLKLHLFPYLRPFFSLLFFLGLLPKRHFYPKANLDGLTRWTRCFLFVLRYWFP